MRATGVVRKVDELGRLVLPSELRRSMNIKYKDPIEIYVDEDKIILKKYSTQLSCVFCKDVGNVIRFKEQNVCGECLELLQKKETKY